MLRDDTEGVLFVNEFYKLILYREKGKEFLKEASWAFRILEFLGAPKGFCIHWWAIAKPRILEPNAFPSRATVNGGWAYRGRNSVWIFREEEWDRVLIHECVHALNWDMFPSSSVKNCLEQSINGTFVDALGEAATELLAEWFWCIIQSPESDFVGITWFKQKEWQLEQAYQILGRRSSFWTEDTSVFAYYLLKTALAQEDDVFFIKWYSGLTEAEDWCSCWKKVFPAFLKRSKNLSINKRISLRMTDPALKSFP